MKLELGTYVNCSNLTDEQRQKLLDKFVELVGDTCNTWNIEEIDDFDEEFCKAREKQLNDWYTQELMKVAKRAMSLEQDLDDVSVIVNGQTTLGASQVMDIKKIIGGK